MTDGKSETEIREMPNEETIRAIEEAEKDIDMFGPFDTVEEAMEALNAPD